MPITSVNANAESLTLTVVADYPVSVERLWDAFADPRQIERFWGPESWPATFIRHDMSVGGRSQYFMTGPNGSKSSGWWEFLKVEPQRMFVVEDGFAHDDGSPNMEMPTMRIQFNFERTPDGSRFIAVTHFTDLKAMEELVKMGMMEGMQSALGQLDATLADLSSFATSRAVDAQILSDTQVRLSRVIRGSVEDVWRAHNNEALMKRWLLGPDGWSMPVCTIAHAVGESYRYEWESIDGENRFGFEGELLESSPPHRSMTTERMIGMDGPGTLNEMTLTEVDGGTLLTIVVTYPNAELRDMILGTGMTGGMEASYRRLENDLSAVE